MKRIYRRLTLVVLMFLSFLLALGGVVALTVPAQADEAEQPANPTVSVYGGEDEWYTLIYDKETKHLTFLLDADYQNYLNMDRADFAGIVDGFTEAFKDAVVYGILNSVVKPDAYVVKAYADSDVPEADLEDIMNRLGDYIDQYLTAENLIKYANGEFDMLFQYVVEEYKNANPEKSFDEIKDKINDFLEKAVEDKFADADEDYRKQVKDAVLAHTAYVVEEVRHNGGVTVSMMDLIAALRSVEVNGSAIYQGGRFDLVALERLLSAFPRPSVVAQMTDAEMRNFVEYALEIDTSYGDFDLTFTFGFNGDCSTIRGAAKLLSDLVDFSYTDDVYNISLRMPDFLSEMYLSATKSNDLTPAQKNALFALFSKPVDELNVSFEQIFASLKTVDFDKLLSNYLDAEWLKGYLGNYLPEDLGTNLTNDKINYFVNSFLGKIVPQLKKLGSLSLEEVKDFLSEFIGRGTNLERAAEKFHSFLNRVDWDNFDAEYIRDLLKDGKVGSKIYRLLDELENFDAFKSFESLVRRVFSFTKAEGGQSVSLLDLYKSEGLISFKGRQDFDIGSLLSQGVNFLVRHGASALEGFDSFLLGYFDTTKYRVSVDMEIYLPDIYKVSYEVNGETVREGLLPVGADVALFSDLEEIQGYSVLYWYDAEDDERKELTEMPAADIVVRPVTEFFLTNLVDETESSKITAVYKPGKGYELSVAVDGVDYAEYSYQWKRNGVEIEGEDAIKATYTVTDVADSDVYTVVVTDKETLYSVESEEFTVEISALEIEITYELVKETGEHAYVYRNAAWSVEWVYDFTSNDDYTSEQLEAFFDIVTEGEGYIYSATDVDTYKVFLSIILKEEFDLENFVITANEKAVEEGKVVENDEWEITPATLKITDIEWSELALVYNRTQQEVTLTFKYEVVEGNHTPVEGLITVTYEGNQGTTVSDAYHAVATFGLDNPNYVLATESNKAETDWKITPAIVEINEQALLWTPATEPAFTYDDTEHTFALNEASLAQAILFNGGDLEYLAGIVTFVKSGDDKATNAGTYTFTLTFSLEDKTNYKFSDETKTVVNKEWKIEYGTIEVDVSKLELKQSEFTFEDGKSYTVELSEASILAAVKVNGQALATVADVLKLVEFKLDGNVTESAIGENYKVTVTLARTDLGKNYKFPADAKDEDFTRDLTWKIVGGDINITGAVWNVNGTAASSDEVTFAYNKDAEYVITLTQLPAGYTMADFNLVITKGGVAVDKIDTVGEYTVTVEAKNGRTVIGYTPLTVVITKATIDVSGVKLSATKFDYDGTEHEVTIQGLPAGEGTAYSYTVDGPLKATDVAQYTVIITFSLIDTENYELSKTSVELAWEIAKKEEPTPSEKDLWGKEGDDVIVTDTTGTHDETKYPADVKKQEDLKDYEKAIKDAVKEKFGDGKDFELGAAYDIHFNDAETGEEAHGVTGNYRVRMLIPEELQDEKAHPDENIWVIHIDDNGNITFIDSTRIGNYKEFTATTFSIYAIIEIVEEASLWWLWLLIAIIIVLLIIIIILLVLLIKKRKAQSEEAASEEDGVTEAIPVDDDSVTEAVPEELVAEEAVVEEAAPVAEAAPIVVAAPAPAPVVAPFGFPVNLDDERLQTMLDRSFTARLSQADDNVKELYSDLKNELLSYKGVKSRISWGYDTFNRGRNKCVKLQIKGKSLIMYIALNPNELNASKYHHKDVSDVSKYAEYPTKLKVKSPRSLKYAKELIEILMSMLGVSKGKPEGITYDVPYQSTEALLQIGLIKIKQAALPEFWATPAETPASDEVAASDEE